MRGYHKSGVLRECFGERLLLSSDLFLPQVLCECFDERLVFWRGASALERGYNKGQSLSMMLSHLPPHPPVLLGYP